MSMTEEQQLEAVEKVLRRAEISRITRNLKSRLALATFKTKRGWEKLALETIEPKIEKELEYSPKKDCGGLTISPIKGLRTAGGRAVSRGSPSPIKNPIPGFPVGKGDSHASHHSAGLIYGHGQPNHVQPGHSQASPVLGTHVTRKRAKTLEGPPPATTYLSASPSVPELRNSVRVESHETNTTNRSNSPPRTPPPKYRDETNREGADLLMYLATSPSPAHKSSFQPYNNNCRFQGSSPFNPPSSARSSNHGYEFPSSSTRATPHTPQQAFNFTDYLNIMTPSPAPGTANGSASHTGATPGTPSRGDRPFPRSARRWLNFDQLPDNRYTSVTSHPTEDLL